MCLKWGRQIPLQPLAGSFEVPGTPPPMEELELRVPSFTNTRTHLFFYSTFFLLQKLQGSNVSVPTMGDRSTLPFQGG